MTDIDDYTRRGIVTTIATGLIAGCLEENPDDADSFHSHPATDDITEAPTLGPDPGTGEATIVAFEDPSCGSCAAFESSTFPKLRKNAIDTGRTSYVWRGVPAIEPWGEQAIRALWAVWRNHHHKFWELKSRYYDERSSITEQTVRQRTRTFLKEDITAPDSEQVVAAMNGSVDWVETRVDRDTGIAEASDVEILPAFCLFRGDEFVTTVTGNQSYGVFEGALEL